MIGDFIREHADHGEADGLRWGEEPICRVLTEHGVEITPSTYYEWRDKLPTPREQRGQGPVDYKRHGTTTLFVELEIATGQVTAAVKPKHRRQEFLSFLRQIDRAYPERELHVVMDNYATHKTPEVKDWLTKQTRFRVHFTPTSGSWLNLVEVWADARFTVPDEASESIAGYLRVPTRAASSRPGAGDGSPAAAESRNEVVLPSRSTAHAVSHARRACGS